MCVPLSSEFRMQLLMILEEVNPLLRLVPGKFPMLAPCFPLLHPEPQCNMRSYVNLSFKC